MSFFHLLYALGVLGALSLGFILHLYYQRAQDRNKLDSAERMAGAIVENAKQEAENTKKAAMLEGKDQLYKERAEFEDSANQRRQEALAVEKRLAVKEEALDRRQQSLDRRDSDLDLRDKGLEGRELAAGQKEQELERLRAEESLRLERLAGLTAESARKMLMEDVEKRGKQEASALMKRLEEEARETADRKAKRIISTAIQRWAAPHTVESTISVVNIPSEDMKGRIIGREGRNIKALENATGVDLIIDDTPETVLLSSFDLLRREVARLALEKLLADGRIHPSRIEEVVAKVREEMESHICEVGEQACLDSGITGLHPELVRLIGRLRYRTSYGQNILVHSQECCHLASSMAAELGLNVAVAKRGAFLHDIGKAMDQEKEGTHTAIGVELARRFGESPAVLHCIEAHHNDVEFQSPEAVIVQAADAISASRPGARRESLETYIKRLKKLEEIASGFKGVTQAYAFQAGREVRIMVEHTQISDLEAFQLAKDVARKVEEELEYPGQIKVTVIRETKAVEYAK
jgi:ribonuclease Y